MSDKPQGTYTVPSYKQYTQSRGYYHGEQITTRHTYTPLEPDSHENAATGAQVATYQDAVITRAWHDEWKAELDEIGTPKPLLLLTRAANIDMDNHAWRTKLVYLCYWDQDHEPDGVIAQRLAKAKRSREKEQVTAHMASEQDMRRKRVKQAAQKAEVVDLTGDDDVGESKLWSHAGAENMENYPLGAFPQPWRV
jgi:hypothetical protein